MLNNGFSKDHWKVSVEKWREIVRRTKEKMPFVSSCAWSDISAATKCGYCEVFYCPEKMSNKGANPCPLFSKDICAFSYFAKSETAFARFIHAMEDIRHGKLSETDLADAWEKALEEANAILAAVEEDGKNRKFC